MASKNKKVFVAMSGGVDSSAAAALLKRAGFNIVGVFMKPWQPNHKTWNMKHETCLWKEDREDALRVAAKLDIPLLTWDLSKEYERCVAKYMIDGYKKGITPNPDVMCNKFIKFGVFLEKALEMGADYIATGHYARIKKDKSLSGKVVSETLGHIPGSQTFGSLFIRLNPRSSFASLHILSSLYGSAHEVPQQPYPAGFYQKSVRQTTSARLKLLKAKDLNKDQSYFLYTLTQKQLARCLFPIGDYTKDEVRKMARKFGLSNWDKKDSQGVCFVGPLKMGEFLKKQIKSKRGLVLRKSDGKVLGEHDGVWFYTVGQRHGFSLAAGEPYYIVDKDIKGNTLYIEKVLSIKNEVLSIKDFNWINGHKDNLPLNCKVKTRYRQKDLDCVILKNGSDKAVVEMKKNNVLLAPGQSAVFYKGKEVLGGGVIM